MAQSLPPTKDQKYYQQKQSGASDSLPEEQNTIYPIDVHVSYRFDMLHQSPVPNTKQKDRMQQSDQLNNTSHQQSQSQGKYNTSVNWGFITKARIWRTDVHIRRRYYLSSCSTKSWCCENKANTEKFYCRSGRNENLLTCWYKRTA